MLYSFCFFIIVSCVSLNGRNWKDTIFCPKWDNSSVWTTCESHMELSFCDIICMTGLWSWVFWFWKSFWILYIHFIALLGKIWWLILAILWKAILSLLGLFRYVSRFWISRQFFCRCSSQLIQFLIIILNAYGLTSWVKCLHRKWCFN